MGLDHRRRGGATPAAGRQRGCRAFPGGAGGGAGLAKDRTGCGRHGAREAGKGACRRSQAAKGGRTDGTGPAAGRTEERGKADRARAAAGRQRPGACAGRLNGGALWKRKAPLAAGLVTGRTGRGLFNGRRRRSKLKPFQAIKKSGQARQQIRRQPF